MAVLQGMKTYLQSLVVMAMPLGLRNRSPFNSLLLGENTVLAIVTFKHLINLKYIYLFQKATVPILKTSENSKLHSPIRILMSVFYCDLPLPLKILCLPSAFLSSWRQFKNKTNKQKNLLSIYQDNIFTVTLLLN